MNRPRRATLTILLAASLLPLSIALAGCSSIRGEVNATDAVDRSLDIPAGTPIKVETFNGGIDVTVGTAGSISAHVDRQGAGATYAEAEADREKIVVSLDLVDGTAVLKAVYSPSPNHISGNRGADVTLRMPPDSPLALVTSNGAVSVRDASRAIDVHTSNGSVDLRGVKGAVDVDTSNGAVTIRSADGTIHVRTTNAAVDIESTHASVDAETSNGALTFAGDLIAGAHRFRTSSGRVELRLPSDAQFAIDASTSNARVTTDFAVDAASGDSNALRGQVGSASDTSIAVSTSNAEIDIAKR